MSDKVRVYEIADEAGATSTDVIEKAKDLGVELKSPQSAVTLEDAEEIMNYIMTGKSDKLKKPEPKKKVPVKKAKSDTSKPKEEVKKEEPEVVKEVEKPKKKEPAKTPVAKEEKKEEKKEEVKKTSQDLVVPRRRELKIIKKKRPKIEENFQKSESEAQPKKQMKSLSEILGNAPEAKEESVAKKPKREKKKTAVKAHDHGKVIDVDRDSDDFASTDSLLGEEVILLDMGLTDSSKLMEEGKAKQTKQIRTTKPSAFGNQPQGLRRSKRKKRVKREKEQEEITAVTIPEDIRVYEFAEKLGKTTSDVISVLFGLGMMVTKNDFLGNDEIEILGEEFGVEVTIKDELEDVNYIEDYHDDDTEDENLVTRPPVITIMGHVDHGKTSLLDKIREAKVAHGEAGGITQHIGAYTIEKDGEKITFVDTPGHEAFSEMRARGASVTDIVIIVVAADDGVKPQTIEAISHAKASGAPIIVAINKIDKESANIDMVKSGMAEHGMTPVDWGGDIEFIGVSAHTGEGIEDLLENILIQAEMLELKADPSVHAKAVVVESSLEKGRGPVATVIVQNGTLRVGDNVVADTTYGRVKAITNDLGKPVKELGLSETGAILGLGEVPSTGSIMVSQDSEKEAKEIATTRAEHARLKELSKSTKVSLEEMSHLIAEGKIKQLPVIIKADVAGSLEAIKGSLEKIKNEEVKVKVVYAGVGGISESDLVLAGASDDCIILGFNVRPTGSVKQKAKAEGITINTYSVIYDLIDDVKEALSGMMSNKVREENTGQAEVRDTFVVPKVGTVAGCMVTDGKVVRGGLARVIRDGIVTYTGKISSLKRFKDDVKEVANGYECGIMFERFNDIKVGDFIETFIEVEEEVTLES